MPPTITDISIDKMPPLANAIKRNFSGPLTICKITKNIVIDNIPLMNDAFVKFIEISIGFMCMGQGFSSMPAPVPL
jgi:hypothetical protein